MPTFTIALEKQQSKRTEVSTIKRQLTEIAERGVSGRRNVWSYSDIRGHDKPSMLPDGVCYKAAITFRRRKAADSDVLDGELSAVSDFMSKAGSHMNWHIVEQTPSWRTENINGSAGPDVDDFVKFDKALTYDDITIPEILIHGSDEDIEAHPAFCNLYGLAPHIRTMAESMYTMKMTKGGRRNHVMFHGRPGCGKSTLFDCWCGKPTGTTWIPGVLPEGSFIRINANSATKAGLEFLFLKRLRDTGVPPFIFVEEMEKTIEAVLTTWLSILDERAEVRKIIHGKLRYAEVRSLVFATVNDKLLFDNLHGGRPGRPGALSSRMIGIYTPRPSQQIMRRILMRDIKLHYPEAGKDAAIWANACLELAQEIQTDDPRKVVAFLDGRTRLLTGEKQADILRLHKLEATDQEPSFVEEI